VAALAIAIDGIVHGLESAVRQRRPGRAWVLALILIGGAVAGVAPLVGNLARRPGPTAGEAVAPESSASAPASLAGVDLVVGSKGFTEQYVLAELLTRELEDRGAGVEAVPNMGSSILFDALRNDTIDVCVDYTGTLFTNVLGLGAPRDRTATRVEVAALLEQRFGVTVLGPLGFENAYALAMRRDRAAALGVRSIGDLAAHAGSLTVGGDPEVFGRPEWKRVRDAYGLGAVRTRGMDSTFMYGAVDSGEVDVITAYSTDGRIAAFDLLVLADPKQAFPPYDAILLLGPRAAALPGVAAALWPLVNSIGDGAMREANRRVDLDGASPAEAARGLAERIARIRRLRSDALLPDD
jgi:osmoprotectant transport system permease protein